MKGNLNKIIYVMAISGFFYSPHFSFAAGSNDNIIKPSESVTTECTEDDKPRVTEDIPETSVQLDETKVISASEAFKGTKMYYTISALVTNRENQVIINRRNGLVIIKAKAEDEFPVTVTATNPCGAASATFKVTIGTTD
ncbi:Uncharacterised protein [Legionella beliardensis]|uniref:BIG2 domain-containing protein n=1 Tax=Legionella beliardensis TaxID=91822 RepID=A0A378HYU2_9GAMM|nr:hypothetical protein [Legionella beliardensis]STX28078.1 Uncharacterised protein [Legionella beliardensis]